MPRDVDCKCGQHWKTHVEDAFAPQCIAPRCTCLRYIPATAPPRVRPKPTAPELVRDPKMSDSAEAVNGLPEPAPRVTPLREPLSRPPLAAAPPVPEPEISTRAAQGPTADELLKAGMRSQIPRTVKLAEKIALMVHDLRGRGAEERRKAEEEKAQARADVAAAPNEGLARRGRHINRTPADCPDCDKRSGNIRIGYLVVDELGEPDRPDRWSDEWRQLCRAPVSHPVTRHSASALVGDRDA